MSCGWGVFTTARDRAELQTKLKEILGSDNVYFQPPASVAIKYPAIVYQRDTTQIHHAGNGLYASYKRYQITVIDRNPDSVIPDKVLELPMCSHDREFVADGLNQDVFTLYF